MKPRPHAASTATELRFAPPPRRAALAIDAGGLRDIYLACEDGVDPARETEIVLVAEAAGFRSLRAWPHPGGEPPSPAALMGCSGLVVLEAPGRSAAIARMEPEWAIAQSIGLPTLIASDDSPLPGFLAGLPASPSSPPPHAFVAVRIHDDFALVREAIRRSVERELGMPCISFEDPRVVTEIAGVRERTRRLIEDASFLVADLSFSENYPSQDSPNIAHEIGTAEAYGVPLVICAHAPRRDLYFSAGDFDALFWRDEEDLAAQLRAWLLPRRGLLGRQVLNFDLADGPDPRARAPRFSSAGAPAYVPPGRRPPSARALLEALRRAVRGGRLRP